MSTTTAPSPRVTQPTLRERNFARNRLGILEACLALTASRPFGDLSVREIAERAGISQGTFFNHFPSKEDVLFFFMRLWTLRVGARARAALEEGSARDAIAAVFELLAREMEEAPRMMLEMISVIAHASAPPQVELTEAERMLALPDQPDAREVREVRLDDLLTGVLRAAVKRGELPKSANVKAATQTIQSIFYGVPIAMRGESASALKRAYDEALSLVWKGLSR